ncbi:hypothetical protein EV183_005180 [Coemansia sp. RSA 2336]|nr:hypothetical protein EV183_005180 [Coemansia sp. RSA 2336]
MNSTLLSRRLFRLPAQRRYASVLAPRFSDRDELSVWRNPLSKLKLQEKMDVDQFQKHHRRVVYEYMGAAPSAPQLKNIDEYVLGLGPYRRSQHTAMPAIKPKEVRSLESRVQQLGRAVEKMEKRAPAAAPAVAAVAALVMGSGGGLYFYFA